MKKSLGVSLAKLLISTAWSDGEIQQSEKEILTKLRLEHPSISDEDWITLKLYMEYPMTQKEVQSVLEGIRSDLDSDEDKALAVKWIQELVYADGKVEFNEFRFYQDAVGFIEGKNVQLNSIQGKFIAGGNEDAKREDQLDDYLFNPVFFRVCRAFKERRMELTCSTSDLRRRCLESSMVASIVKSDNNLHQDEYEGMVDLLNSYLDVPMKMAMEIVNQSLNIEEDLCDLKRICNKYKKISTQLEREEFLVVLVEMIHVDGVVEPEEVQRIQSISSYLGLSSDYLKQRMDEHAE